MVVPGAGAAELGDAGHVPLLTPLETGLATAEQYQPLVVDGRLQAVDIDLAVIEATSVRLDLFDATVVAELDRVDRRAPGDLSWIGRPAQDPQGHVVLVSKNGVLVGNVLTNGRWYAIRVLPNGTQVVMESNAAISPPGLSADAVVTTTGPPATTHSAGPSSTGQVTIDVMIAYTPAARVSQGGTAAIEAVSQLAIDEINLGLSNSLASSRLLLVDTTEVAYTESGSLQTDFVRLIGTADGYMDAVHAARDSAGADLVALYVDNAQDFAGIAQLPNASFPVEAPFSVSLGRYAAGPYFVLAHELGHNLGGGHDPDNGSGTFSYSHGHRVVGEFRTIMSYACARTACPRVLHYSNPDVSHSGHATGTADSDNARAFDDSAHIVAAYRSSNAPLVGFYRELGVLKFVSGTGTVEEVAEAIKRAIGG